MTDQGKETTEQTTAERTLISKTFNQISKRLNVLKGLEGGYKIWLTVKQDENGDTIKIFEIDNTYVPSVRRWLGGQNREDIINTIIDDTNFIQKNFSRLNESAKEKMRVIINAAIPGITNMKQTYTGNAVHEKSLGDVIDILRLYCSKQENKN